MLIALVLYDILGWCLVFVLSLFPWKQWDRKMKDPPPPPPPSMACQVSFYKFRKNKAFKVYCDKVDEILKLTIEENQTMKYRVSENNQEFCIEVWDEKWVRSDVGGHPMRQDTQEVLPPFKTHAEAKRYKEDIFEYVPIQPEEVFKN